MSIQELYDWYDYYNQEPFLADRIEQQLAMSNYILFSTNSKKKAEFEDFMIRNIKKQENNTPPTDEQIKSMFMGIGKVIGS